jgi:hypothetical protein
MAMLPVPTDDDTLSDVVPSMSPVTLFRVRAVCAIVMRNAWLKSMYSVRSARDWMERANTTKMERRKMR